MATYTTNSRLTKMTKGDETGTWGDTANTVFDHIDASMGYVAHALAADADETLTISDGADSNARYMFLDVTGTTTVLRVLTIAPNTLKKVWFIRNSTTGGFSLDVSQGSGGNVTIVNGDTRMVFGDGAGSGAVVADVLANMSVASLNATTADIDGGTVDGAIIGGAAVAAGSFAAIVGTTISMSGASTLTGSVGIGRAPSGVAQVIQGGSFTSDASSTVAAAMGLDTALTGAPGDTSWLSTFVAGSGSSIITQTATESIGLISTARFEEPDITDNLTGTITSAATVYINDAPTEGASNYALFVGAGTTRLDGALEVRSTGPSAIGGVTDGITGLLIRGAFTSDGSNTFAEGTQFGQVLTGASGDTSLLALVDVFGSVVTQTATESITDIVSLLVREPAITDNLTGDITTASTLKIVDAPTEGTSNYALWVASGATQFDGALVVGTANGIDINPGSDIDTDLITVGVTGAPKLWWDESESAWVLDNATFYVSPGIGNPFEVSSANGVVIAAELAHTGSTLGLYGTTPIAKQTGVAVSAAAIHAALVNLGLIAA